MPTIHQNITSIVGQKIQGVEIDHDEGIVRINCEHGYIEMTGDDLELYVELDEVN